MPACLCVQSLIEYGGGITKCLFYKIRHVEMQVSHTLALARSTFTCTSVWYVHRHITVKLPRLRECSPGCAWPQCAWPQCAPTPACLQVLHQVYTAGNVAALTKVHAILTERAAVVDEQLKQVRARAVTAAGCERRSCLKVPEL